MTVQTDLQVDCGWWMQEKTSLCLLHVRIGVFIVPLSLVFLGVVAAKAVDGVVPVVSYKTLAGVAVERHGHSLLQCVERNKPYKSVNA